ncbi:hypothetical protein BG011_001499 [Mortierella polycephala]|uniref:Ras GEF n=1 Tax=Mortierella polycephala TaxID=41804 RepID=A0A9P6QGG4_9FUNG|nr:hypothetical protein BG011_001499 [Mortierella polycephala]
MPRQQRKRVREQRGLAARKLSHVAFSLATPRPSGPVSAAYGRTPTSLNTVRAGMILRYEFNQYLLLEESLAGILQIVPPILQNAKTASAGFGFPHPDTFPEPDAVQAPAALPFPVIAAEPTAATATVAASSSPSRLSPSPALNLPLPASIPSKSSGSVPDTPVHTRARTTSANSTSTVNATRYQIATSILQPPEPPLTDLAQSTTLSPTSVSLLGEPALCTISAAARNLTPSNTQDGAELGSRLADSHEILISQLLTLSSTFTSAIKTLCEQQNEKVLRFDDDMILELLTKWEQEAGKDEQEQEPANSSSTSLVTLGTTNALERYQITVGRVWEEAEVILSSIRKIRDIVQFGRIQHGSDFDDDDSEEDAIERGEEAKKNLYSTLLFHANGLVTVLGEFLECVSGIQRLVGTIKTQRRFQEGRQHDNHTYDPHNEAGLEEPISVVDFIVDEPRPVKHLDPALMRKLNKRKTPFKSITDKVRRSFSDFAKRSTNSLLTIFPPLGDGTNEGFHYDSYTDGEYDSDDWPAAEVVSSYYTEEDFIIRTMSPPESPGIRSEKLRRRHRRSSSKDSSGLPEQYWPGSTRLGFSDDSLSPTHPGSPYSLSSPGPGVSVYAASMSRNMSTEQAVETIGARFQAGSSNTPTTAKNSLESLSESKDFTKNLSFETEACTSPPASSKPDARPPRPPGSLPPLPPSPTHSYFATEEIMNETANFNQKSTRRSSSYLATRSISPLQATPLTLDSPFTRQTSIRMANDRTRYSVRMPADDIPDIVPAVKRNSSASFWRRRSCNDALEKSWQTFQHNPASSGNSETSAPSTPTVSKFGEDSRPSLQMSPFEVNMPHSSKERSSQDGRPISGSSHAWSLSDKHAGRRHSSPITLDAEIVLADALSHRPFFNSQHAQSTTQQNAPSRSSLYKMPTVDENLSARQQQHHPNPQTSEKPSTATLAQLSKTENEPKRRPRLGPRFASQENTRQIGKGYEGSTERNHRDSAGTEGRPQTDMNKRPISVSRFGDMKRAWEILNLDVKRVNQHSHLRAFAGVPRKLEINPMNQRRSIPNNAWALNHPNAQPSATSPRILHICENGADVLVMEMFEGHLQVVAGQLEKLIERLADENAQDGEYVSCFLLSHSFFIDSEDLLDRLIARFHIQPRQGEILYFEKWQTVIQCKILCVFQRWIQIQYEDFELNPNLLKTLKNFLENSVRRSGFKMEAECIEKNISVKSLSPLKNCSVIMEQGRFCLQRSRTRKLSLARAQYRKQSGSPVVLSPQSETMPTSPTEHPIEFGPTPELSAVAPILQLNTRDLARYLTLADMKAFRSITVFELMSGWWKRKQATENKRWSERSDGDSKTISRLSVEIDGPEDGAIEAYTRRANMLSYWVAHEIVSTAGAKTRKQLIKKFIEVAKICRSLNNLHTAMFIISALTSTPVRRLASTWRLVSSKDMETLKGLETLLDPSGNMRCYRQAIAEAEAPTIPFLPILLKDITFILDGNPSMITPRTSISGQAPPVSGECVVATATAGVDPEVVGGSAPNNVADSNETKASNGTNGKEGMLVNFDKFRRLTQYVENAVDMARMVDYSFENQLLRQARVFRPSSPSLYGSNDTDSIHGSIQNSRSSTSIDGSLGALDHISETVECRLVKASGIYGVHQRVVEVEFSTKARSSTSLWKGSVGSHSHSNGGMSSFGGGSSCSLSGSSSGETVIRSVQGEEEYLMGLSLMCEPNR